MIYIRSFAIVLIAAAVPLSGIQMRAGSGALFLLILSLGVDGLALPMFFFALSVVAKSKLHGLIPRSDLRVIPDAGHLVIEERPDALLAEIRSSNPSLTLQ